MTFTDAVKRTYLENYANFAGRASIREYWYAIIFQFISSMALAGFIISTGYLTGTPPETAIQIAVALVLVLNAVMGLPLIAVSVRRLHDLNRSGWWYLALTILSFIPLLGIIVSLAYMLMMLKPGTQNENAFGTKPV